MFDENKHTHPQNNDEGPRHIHRGIKRSEPDEVEVDSADFFSPEPPRPKAPPKPACSCPLKWFILITISASAIAVPILGAGQYSPFRGISR